MCPFQKLLLSYLHFFSYPSAPPQLGALNDYLLPAVLDEPRHRLPAPRTPKAPKQPQAAGRKRLAEPGALAACTRRARDSCCVVRASRRLPLNVPVMRRSCMH